MLIKDRRLIITAVNTTTPLVDISFANQYDSQKNITVQQVFDILSVIPGFDVDNLAKTVAPLGAIALVEGDFVLTPDTTNNVKVFTSILWAVFRPLSYVLEQAKGDIDVAIQQLGFVTAQGDFLDYWGTFFNIPRYSTFSSQTTTSLTKPSVAGKNTTLTVGNTLGIQSGDYIIVGAGTKNFERVFVLTVPDSVTITASLALNHDPGEPIAVENGVHNVEPDYEYSVRLLWETIKPRVNNKAIEELLLRGTGYDTKVVDMSEKILLADGYPTPVDKDAALEFSDFTMVSDGFLTSTSQGFPEDDVRYGLGERYNFGSIGVFVDIPIDNAFYPYTIGQIQDIVERHRAGGTTPWFTVNQVAKETLSLVSEVVAQLQADIQQDIDEGRAMLFGYDDFQFYADHTSPSNVAKMPWLQSNLDKPSLADNVVMQSKQIAIPAVYQSNNESVFVSGPLADGFLGGYNRNLLNADSNSAGDDFRFRIINNQTLVTPETIQFVDEPVILNYQRFSDEYITPRVLEGFSSDIFQISASSIATLPLSFGNRTSGVGSANIGTHHFVIGQRIVIAGTSDSTVNGKWVVISTTTTSVNWADAQANTSFTGGTISSDTSTLSGLDDLTNVGASTDLTFTTPLVISAPTSITGVKFDAVALTQANIRNTPLIIRNLEIPNFGENWNKNYSNDRLWIVPLQDANGNVYYMNISWPYTTTPVVPALRISNPTANISSDKVQIQSGDTINVSWAATNSNGVVTLRQETIATGVILGVIFDLPVAASGTAQYAAGNAITQNTRFHLIVNGNNGQTAEAICTITIVATRTNATPAVITIAAVPDVVELCDSNTTTINYSVNFNSRQTETQTLLFPAGAASMVVAPLNTDPLGTTILAPKEITPGTFQPRQITVSRVGDGLPIPGAWTGLETTTPTFIPIDPTLIQGKNAVFTYDVNYAGSFLKFQGTTVPLPNNGNVFSISQSVNVTLPPPPPSQSIVTQYVVSYSVTADNYATVPVTSTIPVYVQTVKQGPGPFTVTGITPRLLSNFNLESGNGTPLDIDGGWIREFGTGAITFNTTTPIFGTRSIKVAGTVAGGDTSVINATPFTATNGLHTLNITAAVSAPGVVGLAVIRFYNSGGTNIGGSTILKFTSTIPVTQSIAANSTAGVATINVSINYSGSSSIDGFVSYDSIELIPPTASITEAIGPTINQTIPITLFGTGFSSKMQVFLVNKVPSTSDPTAFISQLVQANIVSVDWQSGVLTFIAPRLTYNINGYSVIVNNVDCLGRLLATDSSKVLIYNRSDFRDAPIIDTVSPSTVCLIPGFVSKQVELTGKFFRPNAQVYIVTSTGPVVRPTVVVNLNHLFFTMNQTTAGGYDLIVENADTSSGATKGQPLVLMANNTLPVIDAFGYVAPTSTQGCAYYGVPFTLHWSCSKTSSVSFLSSDPAVQAALQPPPSAFWPSAGSLSVPISTRGTTITVIATNGCNNTASQLITINDLACDRTLKINIVPNPILIKDRLAYKLHTHRSSFNEATNITSDIDISDDPNLKYSLVDANDNPIDPTLAIAGTASQAITLVDRYITANKNGIARIKAYWNGFRDTAPTYVEIPVPISLSATPTPIVFSNIGQVFQLVVKATYSDGTVKTVTADPNIRYYDYDVKVCNVSTTGTVSTNSLGTTYIHCSYFDSFDPTVIVFSTVQVGQPDNCVGFERLFVQPSYAVAGNLIPTPVNCAVTGVNSVNNTSMPDPSGSFSFGYQGITAGTDTVVASTILPALISNALNVLWISPVALVSCSNVTGLFYTADNTGVFNSNGQNPLFTQTFNSLSFNDTALGQNDLVGPAVINAVLDNNGNKTSDLVVAGAGFTLGLGTLTAFNAVLIGNFVIKSAGTYTFSVTSDDGFIMGVGGGATRIGGSYVGVPSSQTTVYSHLPVMGANNIATSPVTSSIVVNFPQPGIYSFEFDWAQGYGQGGTTMFSVWVNGAPVAPITLPAAPANVIPPKAYGVLTLSPDNNGIFVVGGTATFTGSAMGVSQKAGQFTLNVVGDNVRSAMVNGVSVLSGGEIQSLWQYESNKLLSAPQSYQVTIANNSGSVTARASANLITFPNTVINKFTAYDASSAGSTEISNFFAVPYGTPVGLCWNTSNAVKVVLNRFTNGVLDEPDEIVQGSGSRFEVPLVDTVYGIIAFSADGSSIFKQIGVTVLNYKYFTHDWSFGPWYAPGNYWRLWQGRVFASSSVSTIRLGQTATVGLPLWDQGYVFNFWDEYLTPIGGWPAFGPGSFDDRAWSRYTGLHELVDGSISTDGSRPTVNPPVVVYEQNVAQSDTFTVAPTTNTIYQFNLTGWWFWWFYDDWAFTRSSNLGFTGGSFSVPFRRSFHHIWGYSFHAAVNVDPGPKFVVLNVSTASINAGEPVTISYQVAGASSITANFAQNEQFPLTSGSFTVFPDKTTDFAFTATSPTGLTTVGSIHVDVTPQVYYAPCLIMPMPRVDFVALDGVSTATQAVAVGEDEGIHVLELFGDHFLGDRPSTPEIVGTVKVILTHQSGVAATALNVVELSAVANQYIRLKINTHPQTLSGIYTVYVMNDVGISNEKGPKRSFTVAVKIPEFVMNKPVSAYPGNAITLFIDEYNPVRDVGLTVLVGNTAVTPQFVGSTLGDSDFITQMYQQVLGRLPDTIGLNGWISKLAVGSIDRVGLMNALLGSAEYLNSKRNVSVGVGTSLTVPVNSISAIALGLRTNNGISPTHIEYIPIQTPPPPPAVTSTCPVITGITPMSGYQGDVITILGTGFTVNTKVFLGSGISKPVVTTFVNSTTLQFSVPIYATTTIVSITIQDGTCSDSHTGFMVNQLDTTPPDPGIQPTRGPGGVNFPGASGSFASAGIGAANPVGLSSTSSVPTTVANPSGTVLTQPSLTATSTNTATIVTLSVNNVPITNVSSAQMTTVNFVDVASARLQLR